MQLKSDSRGITLIELIIAISLLTVVLFSAYFFLAFSTRTMKDIEAQFDAGQVARMAFINMEEDIRKAKAVIIDSTKHKAVEVMDYGMLINVYTDVDNDGIIQLVQYKLEGNQLKRGEASLGDTPSTCTIIADSIKNDVTSPPTPIFTIDKKVVIINLLVLDKEGFLDDSPISIKTSITVRSKEAMK